MMLLELNQTYIRNGGPSLIQNLPIKVLTKIFLIATVCILFAIESHASSSNVSKSFPDGSSYNGEVNSSGIPHGKGTFTWPDGDQYTGGFVDGLKTGKGTYTWANGNKYTGDWVNDQKTGKGTYTWASGNKYTGDWVNDQRTGKGTFTWPSGSKYTGDWVNDQKTGKGVYTWANGDQYTGDYVNNQHHGKGTFTWANGNKYTGDYVNNQHHGKGTYTWADGDQYTGGWVNDKPTGKGTFTKQDGSKYAADDAKEISKEALPVKKKVVKKKRREMRWAIHIGSYLSRGEAEGIAKMIQSVGDNTYITEHDEGGKHWYRVRVGFYQSQKEAARYAQELSARFTSQELWVVLPTREEVMSHSDSID